MLRVALKKLRLLGITNIRSFCSVLSCELLLLICIGYVNSTIYTDVPWHEPMLNVHCIHYSDGDGFTYVSSVDPQFA